MEISYRSLSLVLIAATLIPQTTHACGFIGSMPQYIIPFVFIGVAFLYTLFQTYSFACKKISPHQALKKVRNISLIFVFILFFTQFFIGLTFTTFCFKTPEENYVHNTLFSGVLSAFGVALISTWYTTMLLWVKRMLPQLWTYLAYTLLFVVQILLALMLLKLTIFFPESFPNNGITIPTVPTTFIR